VRFRASGAGRERSGDAKRFALPAEFFFRFRWEPVPRLVRLSASFYHLLDSTS